MVGNNTQKKQEYPRKQGKEGATELNGTAHGTHKKNTLRERRSWTDQMKLFPIDEVVSICVCIGVVHVCQ